MEYNFKRIDVHYVTIEADSLEEAQAIADGTYETADKLDTALERLLDELA